MNEITYIDRLTQKKKKEEIYGRFFLELMYGKGIVFRLFSFFLLPLFARLPCFSWGYGALQKSRWSRFKIRSFIQRYRIDSSEFLDPVDSFNSFNDFFIRRLKREARPFVQGENVAVLPADARYLAFPKIRKANGIWVKGKSFTLGELLQDNELANQYSEGAMLIARLCPLDYHRFHFPCRCVPGEAQLINGPLYSVNPIALKRNIQILSENKRVITPLKTRQFGTILFIEVGATYVGSIHQTYQPGKEYEKGDEKGYFSFGGSCLILLFEPDQMILDSDLIESSIKKIEVKGLLGQSMGKSLQMGHRSTLCPLAGQ